jgi:hypothetical protein
MDFECLRLIVCYYWLLHCCQWPHIISMDSLFYILQLVPWPCPCYCNSLLVDDVRVRGHTKSGKHVAHVGYRYNIKVLPENHNHHSYLSKAVTILITNFISDKAFSREPNILFLVLHTTNVLLKCTATLLQVMWVWLSSFFLTLSCPTSWKLCYFTLQQLVTSVAAIKP